MTRRRWIAERWDLATATIAGPAGRAFSSRPARAAGHAGRRRRRRSRLSCRGGCGRKRVGELSEVRFNLAAELVADPALPITLVMAIYKFDRMEWIIEKATELGVSEIAPVVARRTDKHLALAAEKRAERWRRIAHEASQQARRSDVPAIHRPVPLTDRVATPSVATRIVLAEQERATTLRDAVEQAIASSPEPDACFRDRNRA